MEDLEKNIGVDFDDQLLLKEALTHRSYINENPDWPTDHNERLEYLGDAVLELIVTDFLFKKFPEYDEGKLTSVRAALVNHSMLSRVADEINLGNYVFLSKGEASSSDRAQEAIFANAVEALIGAIYLDQGYEISKQFIGRFILTNLKMVMDNGLYQDPKSLLQEVVQEKFKITPGYKVLKEEGPDHNKEFLVGVYFDDDLKAKGRGDSKQEAERAAAQNALEYLDNVDYGGDK